MNENLKQTIEDLIESIDNGIDSRKRLYVSTAIFDRGVNEGLFKPCGSWRTVTESGRRATYGRLADVYEANQKEAYFL